MKIDVTDINQWHKQILYILANQIQTTIQTIFCLLANNNQ